MVSNKVSIKECIFLSDIYFKPEHICVLFEKEDNYIAFPSGKNITKGILINKETGLIKPVQEGRNEPYNTIRRAKQVWFWCDDKEYAEKIYEKNRKEYTKEKEVKDKMIERKRLVYTDILKKDILNRAHINDKNKVWMTDSDVFKTINKTQTGFDIRKTLKGLENESQVWKKVSEREKEQYNKDYADGVSYGIRVAMLYMLHNSNRG